MTGTTPPKWTGTLIGKMHVNKVKNADLAKELGVSEGYISMLLSATRETKGARERLENAYEAILARRNN